MVRLVLLVDAEKPDLVPSSFLGVDRLQWLHENAGAAAVEVDDETSFPIADLLAVVCLPDHATLGRPRSKTSTSKRAHCCRSAVTPLSSA